MAPRVYFFFCLFHFSRARCSDSNLLSIYDVQGSNLIISVRYYYYDHYTDLKNWETEVSYLSKVMKGVIVEQVFRLKQLPIASTFSSISLYTPFIGAQYIEWSYSW